MKRRLLALLATGVVAASCTGDDDDDDGGTPADVSGIVKAGSDTGDVLLVGAMVEEVGTSNSATTASGGVFTISVNATETVYLRAVFAGYLSTQRGVVAPVGGVTGFDINLPADVQVAQVTSALGITFDPLKGALAVEFDGAFTSTQGGFTATIAAATEGSFTFDSSGNPVLSSVTLPGGDDTLIYYNVDAGDTTVVVNPPGAIACVSESGIASELVSADTLTNVFFDCQ